MNFSLVVLPGLLCHPTAGPHGQCRKRSTLFHMFESFCISHGLENTLDRVPWICFLLSVRSVHFIEQNSALIPFPLQLRCKYLFSPLFSVRQFGQCIALNRQVQPFFVGFGNRMVKTLCEQEQKGLVNTALPPLPKIILHKFILQTIGRQQSKDSLLASILWMF